MNLLGLDLEVAYQEAQNKIKELEEIIRTQNAENRLFRQEIMMWRQAYTTVSVGDRNG